MRRIASQCVLMAALAAAGTPLPGAEEKVKPDPKIDLPAHRFWSHVKCMLIVDESHPLYESFGGFHHVYANEKAFPSTMTLKPFPEGSVLVFVLYDAAEKDGAFTTGVKKLTAVMEKRGKYEATGGWGFQAWGADGKPLVFDGGAACFACHKEKAASTDFVFSRAAP